jgi:hypothetical protein
LWWILRQQDGDKKKEKRKKDHLVYQNLRPVFNNISLPLGVNFAPRGEL